MKQRDIVENYLKGNTNCNYGSSLWIGGDKLYSYNTVLAQRDKDLYYVNFTYYSNTTSRHRGYLVRALKERDIVFIPVDNKPQGVQNLIQ